MVTMHNRARPHHTHPHTTRITSITSMGTRVEVGVAVGVEVGVEVGLRVWRAWRARKIWRV